MKICSRLNPGSWIAIGVAIGAGFGAAIHDMAMGVGIGAGMGALFMAIASSTRPQKRKD